MKNVIKGATKSKTIYFAMAISVLGPALDNFPELRSFLGDNYGISFVLLSMVMAYLRFVTTKPLDDK